MSSNNDLLDIKRDIRLELLNYYDSLKNEIDLNTQKALTILKNEGEIKLKANELLELNDQLVSVVDIISRQNFIKIDDFFENNRTQLMSVILKNGNNYSEADLKKIIFQNHCFFIPGNDLGLRIDHCIGVLVTSDWFMSQDEINFVRMDMEKNGIKAKRTLELKENQLTMHFSHKNCLPNDKLFELSIINLKQNKQKEQQATLEVLHLEDRSICVININSFNQFENLRELNLSSNKLGALKKETFNNLKTLEILRLEDCSIKSIEADAFVKLKNLKFLNLTRNNLNLICKHFFNGLSNLHKLYLKSCAIKFIENNTFVNLNNLKVLDLSSNPIGLISTSFFNGLYKLEKLDLTRCHMIRKIDSNAFNQMLNLREVDLPNTVDLVGMANNLDSLLPDMEVVSLEMC